MNAETFLSNWREKLLGDLQPFSDSGTTVEVVESTNRTLGLTWYVRGEPLTAYFSGFELGDVRVTFNGDKYTYRTFFASQQMGDLQSLARMIANSMPPTAYVHTKAREVIDTDGLQTDATEREAISLLQSLVDRSDSIESTHAIVVTGEPGAGKTSVLREFVRQTAENFRLGKTTRLLLYVNAQGRALARLGEAFAAELNELRSSLPIGAVAVLTRLDLLVPVIDGFDELLGAGGYADAFGSLSVFMEELNGHGALIASARSTYYEQEFVSRVSRVSTLGAQSWTQTPVRVCAWGEAEFEEFINHQKNRLPTDADTSQFEERINNIFSQNKHLRSRPFFVSKVAALILSGQALINSESIQSQLVDAYIDRERTQKLLDQDGRPLLTRDQITSLYCELAEEMWRQETRELDRRSIKEIAEFLVTDSEISGNAASAIVDRSPSMAFLDQGSRRSSIVFEHEVFFSHFLALRLARQVSAEGTPLAPLLGRSSLSEDLASQTARNLAEITPRALRGIVDRINFAASQQTLRQTTVRENGGTLVLGLISAHREIAGEADLCIKHLVFPGNTLLRNECIKFVRFHGCEFRRVDFRGTQIHDCTVPDCIFSEIQVDESGTVLAFRPRADLKQFVGLQVWTASGLRTEYDPAAIRDVLVSLQAVSEESLALERPPNEAVVRMIEILARAYLRGNPITIEDPKLAILRTNPDWPELERLLVKFSLVSREHRPTKGSRKEFLRRQVDFGLVLNCADAGANSPESIREFWGAVRQWRT